MRTIDIARLSLDSDCLVLDLGCGAGRHTHAVAFDYGCKAIGLDISEADLTTAKKSWESIAKDAPEVSGSAEFTQGNIYKLPFKDQLADSIICSEVLEHLIHYPVALEEFFRVLKPGGRLAISVPRAYCEKICWLLDENYHNEEGGHIRIFHAASLQKEIEHCGFNFSYRHHEHGLHAPYWWLKCLFGVQKTDHNPIIKLYHKVLVAAIMKKGIAYRLDKWLAPLMGKSIVMYFTKPDVSKPTSTAKNS